MHTTSRQAQPDRARLGGDRGLTFLILGALVLIAVGVISIPLVVRRAPILEPLTTPAGTVQRFYQALYAGDYATAYDFLSTDLQAQISLSQFQQQLNIDLQHSQMRVLATTIIGTHATVQIRVTYFQAGGIFGSDEWSIEDEVLLQREDQRWTIIGGPLYIPVESMR